MRGARGGVTLARSPNDISLLEVVEAIDGPLQLNECVNGSYDCPMGDCPMQGVWHDAQVDLVQRLKSTTFGNLKNGRS